MFLLYLRQEKKKNKNMGRRSKFDASFKAKVAIEALKESKTLQELAVEFNIAPSLISRWKEEFIRNSAAAFAPVEENSREVKKLKAENDRMLKIIGRQKVEVDFFAKACEEAGLKVR